MAPAARGNSGDAMRVAVQSKQAHIYLMALAKQLDPKSSLAEEGTPKNMYFCESDASFEDWLSNLPSDDWTGAIDESTLINVTWVDGVGFVQRDA